MKIVVLSPEQLRTLAENAPAERQRRVPEVRIVPFVAERGAQPQPLQRAPLDSSTLLAQLRGALEGPGIIQAEAVPAEQLWGSCFKTFRREVLPRLPRAVVVVSHGNALKHELGIDSPVPNGGAILMLGEGHAVLWVRHCTTCHNVDRKGSAGLTSCLSFDELAPVAALVRRTNLPVCCSAMPRAVLTALALQRHVTELERLGFARAFGACTAPIPPRLLEEHRRAWACRPGRHTPFCAQIPISSATQSSVNATMPAST